MGARATKVPREESRRPIPIGDGAGHRSYPSEERTSAWQHVERETAGNAACAARSPRCARRLEPVDKLVAKPDRLLREPFRQVLIRRSRGVERVAPGARVVCSSAARHPSPVETRLVYQPKLAHCPGERRMVSRIFTSWNHLSSWLRQIERLRGSVPAVSGAASTQVFVALRGRRWRVLLKTDRPL